MNSSFSSFCLSFVSGPYRWLVREQKKFSSLIPFTPDGNHFQFFSDNEAELLTSRDNEKAYEDADFEHYILACASGKRCLIKGKGENCLDVLMKHADQQKISYPFYVIKILKKILKSHRLHQPEEIIALTFSACLLIFEKKTSSEDEIKLIWKEIFYYLDDNKKQIECLFVKALSFALQSPFLTFKNVLDQLQDSSYLSLNLSRSLFLAPINHEKPSIRIQFSSYSFLIPFHPSQGLQQLSQIKDPQAWEALEVLNHGFSSFISFEKPHSLLKPYIDHPDSEFKKVKEIALAFLNH